MFLHRDFELEKSLNVPEDSVIISKEAWKAATQPVELSRRNLLTLLHKLDMPGSARTIIKPGGTIIKVVTDEEAYGDRAPGAAHPDTEVFIKEMGLALDFMRRQQ